MRFPRRTPIGRSTKLTNLAAEICQAPICLISLVEADRQLFFARTGLLAEQTPREMSFCQHAMAQDEIMLVPDARADPRFADNALVTGAPFIRFYAGAPLRSREGAPLGALCVIDHAPREGLTALQAKALRVLARQVMTALDARRRLKRQAVSDLAFERALDEREEPFPRAGRCHAANGVVLPARRVHRLLQCALV